VQIKKIASLVLAAGLLLSACNVSASGSDADVATAAAMTVQAALNQAALATPTASTGSGEATPTSSDAFASVGDPTNCRTGPGVSYERITQIQPSDSVKIVGFYAPNYWIVSTSAGECWVSGEFITPVGSYQSVPTVADAPTLAVSPSNGIKIKSYDYTCDLAASQATVTIIWSDTDGESGYRILRNGTQIAELAADVTFYKETITLLSGQSAGYNVVSFTSDETFTSSTVTIGC